MFHAGPGTDIPHVQSPIWQDGYSHGRQGVQEQVRSNSHEEWNKEFRQVRTKMPEGSVDGRVKKRVVEQCPMSRE